MRMMAIGALAAVLAAGCGGDGGAVPGTGDGGGLDGRAAGACSDDPSCDDGVFCNGAERCQPGAAGADPRGCVAGEIVDCDDGVACTRDGCSEARGACVADAPDADGDGHGAADCVDAEGNPLGDDCDDADARAYPGNAEVCDAHDDDCNPETFGFLDADADGAASTACCNADVCGGDCDDADGAIRPGAADGPPGACDGLDQDCDGTADEGCPCEDGDERECGTAMGMMRIGVCLPGMQVCVAGAWTDSCTGEVRPSLEFCNGLDDDCDGTSDEETLRTYYRDGDGDGFGLMAETATACAAPEGYASVVGDCDDLDPTINPSAAERCNAVDDDCDTDVDEALLRPYYVDADGDGFGDPTMATSTCDPGPGLSTVGTDCDDTRGASNPAAPEVCDGLDNDCDGAVDDGVLRPFYRDDDGDGFGQTSMTMDACSVPAGYASAGRDCDDLRAFSNPGAPEVCDGFDNNCDGRVDEGVRRTFFRDVDGDAFGATAMTMSACTTPAGYSDRAGDCNDAMAGINPAAAEVCDGVDNDCNMTVDPGCMCINGTSRSCGTSMVGECRLGTQTCTTGAWGPCVGSVGPTGETCNMRDDDCDGTTDDGVLVTYYRDADGDGFGHPTMTTMACTLPTGHALAGTDCDDANNAVHPGHSEVCNRRDDDCSSGGGVLLAEDRDNDGYTAVGYTGCAAGFPTTDCRDSSALFRPGAAFQAEPVCSAGVACVTGGGIWTCWGARDATTLMCTGMVAPIGATLTWDYNCSGADERFPRWPGCTCSALMCRNTDPLYLSLTGPSYPVGSPPACGSTVTYVACGGMCGVSCGPMTTGSQRIPCR